MICASDGGLKNKIGTCGYILYLYNSSTPLISGHSEELQLSPKASCTRQELLGQLCMEYWLQILQSTLGELARKITIELVTDSQASIVLFYWKINEEADQLTTRSRGQVEQGKLLPHHPPFLPGSRAMCFIDGISCMDNLKQAIHTRVYEQHFIDNLCLKHGWMTNIFQIIDWKQHSGAVQSFPQIQRITVLKHIHGWLATQKRRCHEGASATSQCLLCHNDKDNMHIFHCKHKEMTRLRQIELITFTQRIRQTTNKDTALAIITGVHCFLQNTRVDIYLQEFAPTGEIQMAMEEQEAIGWDQVLLGRISQRWKTIGPSSDFKMDGNEWAKKVIIKGITVGIDLWTYRNKLIHGSDGGVSHLELDRILRLITLIYNELPPALKNEQELIFTNDKETKLTQIYHTQISWLDSVRWIFPSQYR